MRKAFALSLVLGSIALGGCSVTTDGVTSTTDSVVTAFQNMCLALPTAHQNFIAIATTFKVKQSVMDGELKAYNAGVALCASGAVQTTADAVKAVASTVQQIDDATKRAGS